MQAGALNQRTIEGDGDDGCGRVAPLCADRVQIGDAKTGPEHAGAQQRLGRGWPRQTRVQHGLRIGQQMAHVVGAAFHEIGPKRVPVVIRNRRGAQQCLVRFVIAGQGGKGMPAAPRRAANCSRPYDQ